ncbi:phytoene desaturase family protein [Granulicella sibirica]|uniref:Phytoene dehydrogenase n=1 Tax=Granulicella sibirica TaxID=2479048 RepID=A0A4Q0T9Q0_9BACT|nr:NAD(P)/FAD-dependent oxidoreductase [Granulicella sibirica]RXH58351.1 Phytoene dehydrogenase [Granulicella sibirica]
MARANVIGAGPNGLAAAITLARAGVAVTVYEALEWVGGAASTREVTLPLFRHDLGSSVYPMGVASPFFRSLPLAEYGFRWVEPEAPLAHPLDDGSAVMMEHGLASTAASLGRSDGAAYRGLIGPLVDGWEDLVGEILQPVLHVPLHPVVLGRFGMGAVMPATTLAGMRFRGVRAKALFAGNAAHSVMPLTSPLSSAVGLVLQAAGHATGWPVAAGGAQSLSDALAGILRGVGGEIRLGMRVERLEDLPAADITMFDLTPRQAVRILGDRLGAGTKGRLAGFRYGPGAFKIDYALSEAIPWRAPECRRAATVHLGGTIEEIVASEAACWEGRTDVAPFVLLVQPSLFDPGRAPGGRHTAWAYCHVPQGYAGDRTEAIERQIERFAPGFRDCVLARKTWTTGELEGWNANLVGGDLSGGAMTVGQIVARPTVSGYRTGVKGVYLCGSSTGPGGGVHGMCGYGAASVALRDLRG